ncbi:MAG: protein kinase [Lachnospiraceae bacterium]|nr:protein kinase [Lachnospiraceae bacterium]
MMIGETKLGYKITELVGQGGFGTVYKAVKKNKAMETVRALKHISLPSKKQWTDIYNSMGNDMVRTDAYFDTILQEILNEIRILADLTNKGVKNVVWYYENEIEDTPSPKHYDIYLLMEYLTALPSYIETHELKVKDVIKIGTDILSALIECHKRKIIHRDIKTDNIFISEDGDYKLGDFGVSKKLSDRSRATSMKGTPNYIAPEVYLGEAYDETVDLYSLGIVLYRLLNYNRNPFMPEYPVSFDSEDEDRAFEMRMKGETPNYPAFANGDLGDIIIKSISNKENRFKSATEFKEALEKVASNMTNEELEIVVLENVLKNVDFSTFGSEARNDLTQMAQNNSSINNMQQSMQANQNNNSFSTNSMNNSFTTNDTNKKNKMIVPLIAGLVAVIGISAFLLLRGGAGSSGTFIQENGITKFKKKNGDYAQNEWIFYDNNEYYFNGRQSLVTNEAVDYNGKTYYVNSDGAKIINDWYRSNGKVYFLDENGEPYKDTAKIINGETVFFNTAGEMIKNDWASYEGYYYFVDSEGVMLKNTYKNFGANEWYYLGSDGKMLQSTFYDIEGKTYYFESDGKLKMNSLVLVDGSLYFAGVDGAIVKGGWCANNQYYADANGKILMNTTTPDGVKVDSSGRRVQETIAYTPAPTTAQLNNTIPNTTVAPAETTSTTQNSTSSIHLASTDKASDTGSVIYSGKVDWGDHLRDTIKIDLDEYGESGNARIAINISKIKPDGSSEVEAFNSVVEDLYEEVYNRAMNELPYKQFDFTDTSLGTCNENEVIVNYKGEIIFDDNQKEKLHYKITLNRKSSNASYIKVK